MLKLNYSLFLFSELSFRTLLLSTFDCKFDLLVLFLASWSGFMFVVDLMYI